MHNNILSIKSLFGPVIFMKSIKLDNQKKKRKVTPILVSYYRRGLFDENSSVFRSNFLQIVLLYVHFKGPYHEAL